MSAPNLASSGATVNGKTAHLAATNTEADLIAAIATGHCARVEAVYAANIHASVVGWVSLWHKAGGTEYHLANQMTIPLNATLNILDGRILYLEEGDSLRVQANASSNVDVNAPYEDIS